MTMQNEINDRKDGESERTWKLATKVKCKETGGKLEGGKDRFIEKELRPSAPQQQQS